MKKTPSPDPSNSRREFLSNLLHPITNAKELWRALQTGRLYKPQAGERIVTRDRRELAAISAMTKRRFLVLGTQTAAAAAVAVTAIRVIPGIEFGPRPLEQFKHMGLGHRIDDSASPEAQNNPKPVLEINRKLQQVYDRLQRNLPQEETPEAVARLVALNGYIPFWKTAMELLPSVDPDSSELKEIADFFRHYPFQAETTPKPQYDYKKDSLEVPVMRAIPNFWAVLLMAQAVQYARLRKTAKLPPNADAQRNIHHVAEMNAFQIADAACGGKLWNAYAEKTGALLHRIESEKLDEETTMQELKKILAEIHDENFGLKLADMPDIDRLIILSKLGRWTAMYYFSEDMPTNQQDKLSNIAQKLYSRIDEETNHVWQKSCPCRLLKKAKEQFSEQ